MTAPSADIDESTVRLSSHIHVAQASKRRISQCNQDFEGPSQHLRIGDHLPVARIEPIRRKGTIPHFHWAGISMKTYESSQSTVCDNKGSCVAGEGLQ